MTTERPNKQSMIFILIGGIIIFYLFFLSSFTDKIDDVSLKNSIDFDQVTSINATSTENITLNALSGNSTAYVCVYANGTLYRHAKSC